MRKRISRQKKTQIVNLCLEGLTRDEICKRTGVSAGTVSGVIREFTDCADSTSPEEAAKEYGVTETFESLRSLAVDIRKNGTSVKELIRLATILRRIKKLIPLDKLDGLVRAAESIGNKAHVEASVSMFLIEEQTGKSHDDIVTDLEGKVVKVKKLSEKIQHLNAEIKKLSSEKKKAQADFENEKTKLDKELKERLHEHNLTLEQVERISKIERSLNIHAVDLAQLEELLRVLNAVEEAGHDAGSLVKSVENVESLKAQSEAEAKKLTDTRQQAARLNETVSALEEKLTAAKAVVERCHELESVGWTRENLERAIKLAKEAGSPEEALGRLELLKPSAELEAKLDRVETETAKIIEKNRRLQKRYGSLKKKFKALEDATNAVMALFKIGFTTKILLSIQDVARKYGSVPIFMEAFSRFKQLKELQTKIERLEHEEKSLKSEVEKKRREVARLDTLREAVAMKAGKIQEELERRMNVISGIKFLIAFAADPASLTTESATWLVERLRIWAENKQTEIAKNTFLTLELKVGEKARWLLESLRKLKERGY